MVSNWLSLLSWLLPCNQLVLSSCKVLSLSSPSCYSLHYPYGIRLSTLGWPAHSPSISGSYYQSIRAALIEWMKYPGRWFRYEGPSLSVISWRLEVMCHIMMAWLARGVHYVIYHEGLRCGLPSLCDISWWLEVWGAFIMCHIIKAWGVGGLHYVIYHDGLRCEGPSLCDISWWLEV